MAHLSATHSPHMELRGTAALASVACLIGVAFGLSTLLTPLYIIYQQAFGFSQITLTLVYAAYALGNVTALLFFGRISDRAGRRVTALTGVAALTLSALVFLFATGTPALYVGRILCGLGIGIASGTGNAWLAELIGRGDKARAAMIGTSSNFVGLGLATVLSGVLAEYAPWPLHLSFVVYLVFLATAAVLIWFTPETVRQRGTRMSLAEIRPELSLPKEIRARFVAPAITGFGLMALVGLYAALMPAILSQDLHIKNHAAAGALFFELSAVVAVVIVTTRNFASHKAMMLSLALMIPAAAAIVAAQASGILWVMLAATAAVAVSTGLGYRGSLQVMNQIAPADRRAAVVSSYFICCFAGNALPVIGVGVLATLTSMTVADIVFAVMISLFAVVALVFAWRYRAKG